MLSIKRMERMIGVLLLTGTLVSTVLVFIGGMMYLLHAGADPVRFDLLQREAVPVSKSELWQLAFSFSALGLIQLGLLALVITQILRVSLLVGLFAAIRDYKFAAISLFILCVLLYSFIWR